MKSNVIFVDHELLTPNMLCFSINLATYCENTISVFYVDLRYTKIFIKVRMQQYLTIFGPVTQTF